MAYKRSTIHHNRHIDYSLSQKPTNKKHPDVSKKLSNFFQKHQDVLYKNSRSFFKTETELPALYDD